MLYIGDALTEIKKLPSESVHCCVTSPPYWGLRDYGIVGQLGQEESPFEYIDKVVSIFAEVRRVLRQDGTLWLNLGDSYASGKDKKYSSKGYSDPGWSARSSRKPPAGFKRKDLIGIPWRVAFALQADGWYLRRDIIWQKPNAMPESVSDRPTAAHEYIFLMSKNEKYFYDAAAIREKAKESSVRRLQENIEQQKGSSWAHGGEKTMKAVCFGGSTYSGKEWTPDMAGGAPGIDNRKHAPYIMVNKRTVWSVATANYKEAHFATFPEKLIIPCVLAGCPVGGIVLDPFMGSGTTAYVAEKYGRKWVGIELNPEYEALINKRLSVIQIGMEAYL